MRKRREALAGEVTSLDRVPLARVEETLAKGEVENAFYQILASGISPQSVPAIRMRAMLLLRQNRLDEAKWAIEEALRRNPEAICYKMAGDWAFLKNDYEKAKAMYEEAIKRSPQHADCIHDLGVACHQLGETETALGHLRKSIEIAPQRADFRHHLALLLCTDGYLDEGWRLMDARMDIPGICSNFPDPEKYWKGEDLKDRVIVLRREQGFGDTIMFGRFAEIFLKMGARKVYFFIQRDMMTWCRWRYPDERIVPWPDHAPPPTDFDYHVNIMSLPKFFPNEYFTIPERQETGEGIGFCWFGSPTHKNDHHRSIELKRWEPIFNCGVPEKFYCLAWGRFVEKPPFVDYLIDTCWDWKMTAEAIRKLKLVITVDTAIAHLAGDMGIPVWLLLPKMCDFRWLLTGDTTPWYASMRLYRQPELWDWDSVIQRVVVDLKRLYQLP